MRTIDTNRASDSRPVESNAPADVNVGNLVKDWISSYKRLTGTTIKLVMADSKLAAISLTQIIAIALLASFAALGVWVCLLILGASALMALGLSFTLVVTLFLVLHIAALACLLLLARSTASGLDFSATRQVLSPQNEESGNDHHGTREQNSEYANNL